MLDLVLKSALSFGIIVISWTFLARKIYPTKSWRQILFPMMNKEPESIHEIEYFRSLDFSEVPEAYLNKVKYQLLKLSRIHYCEFSGKKILVNTDEYKKPFYIEGDNDTVTILVKK